MMQDNEENGWKPTDRILRGLVVKSYLPLKRYPFLVTENDHFFNLYPGDELYIFEQTTDGKWFRAYFCWIPLPEAYVSGMASVGDRLPHLRNKLVIVPQKFVHLNSSKVIPEISFLKLPASSDFHSLISEECEAPSLYESLVLNERSQEAKSKYPAKPSRPSFPYYRYQDRPFVDELGPVLGLLSSHIYAMYSAGEFTIYEKLTILFYKLDAICVRLRFGLMTSSEYVKIIKAASSLLTNMSKLISSKGGSDKDASSSNQITSDPSGVEAIFARDINTGELLSYEKDSLQSVMLNSMLHGLCKDFPVANSNLLETDVPPHTLFDSTQSHILVDVNDVISDASIGNPMLNNLCASMYLSSNRERLTEPFTVNIDSERIFSLNSISAALFKNLSASQIERGNIYLVVVLTEKINIAVNGSSSAKEPPSSSPFIPYKSSTQGKIHSIRRGVAAGAVDITRVFAKYNESNASTDEASKFKIYLFGSFFTRSGMRNNVGAGPWNSDMTGWGDLIDRILSNSCKGVAVNPRATSLSVTVKEIRGGAAVEESLKTSIGAIKIIPTYFYDILSEPEERLYLSIGKVSLADDLANESNVESISIQILSENEHVKFSRSVDENLLENKWEFVSVRPGEAVGGLVRIQGLEYMGENESIEVLAYLNGLLLARSYIYVKKGDIIKTYKKFTSFQLLSPLREPLVNIEIASQYVGKMFNMDSALKKFLGLPKSYRVADSDSAHHYEDTLAALNKVGFDQLHKYFDELLRNYLRLFEHLEKNESEKFQEELCDKAFISFVEFIDKVMVRNDRFRSTFGKIYKDSLENPIDVPNVGSIILRHMTKIFSNSHLTWDTLGSTVSRCSVYLLMVSVMSSKNSDVEWRRSFEMLFSQVCQFLSNSSDSLFGDQILVLQTYDLWLDTISINYQPKALVQFSLGLFQSCRNKEDNLNFSTRKLSPMEDRYLNSKLSLLRRIIVHKALADYLFLSGTSHTVRLAFLSKCIDWALQPYTHEFLHISTTRLGNGVLITLLEKADDRKFQRNVIRVLPTLFRAFILTRKHCQEINLFKPKITFTKLFPFSIPCPFIPMDSLINTEIIVEVLVEIATIICEISKTAEKLYGTNPSFGEVIKECELDVEFQTGFCLKQISNTHILTLYHMVKIFSRGDFFPGKKWLAVSAMLNRSLMTIITMYKTFMINESIHEGNERANIKLWSAYLKAIFTLANHKVSFLIKLGIIPRKAVYRISGNLKRQAAELLNDGWDALAAGYDMTSATKFGIGDVGPNQMALLKDNFSLIQEMLIFAFHRHIDAVKIGCKIIWCTAINFWMAFGDLQPFLDICIPELYNAYQSGRLYVTDVELERFKLCWLYTAHIPADDPSYLPIVTSMEEIFGFLHLISDAYKISDQEEFDNDRTAVHMEMFGYLLDANRPELFHKMVYDLFIHFIRRKDHVQAALCLELLANTYNWNPNDCLSCIPYPPLPEQSSFERKEYLYKESARNFAKGLKLEKALSIYKDLIAAYDQINYDLNGLAFVHGEISNLYTNLQTIDRLVPTYFKVSFSGFGFPNSLRNKRFIFEGLPFEHIMSMRNRLLKIYHGTTIVQAQERIDDLFMNSSMGRFIHVTSVEPQLEISEEYQTKGDKKNMVNNKIWMYIENRNLRTFSNSRRLPGATNVTDLWVDEYTYKTASTFPTLMNRSEIKEISQRKLSPLQNALRSLQIKIQELNGLENMCWKAIKEQGDYSELFNELSRNLTGTIDAPVNGGMTQYREFLKPPMASQLEESDLNILTSAFDGLAIVLARCLILHQELLPSENLMVSHKMLVTLFEKNFSPEIKSNNIDIEGINSSLVMRSTSQPSSSPHLTKGQLQKAVQPNYAKHDKIHTSSIHSRESNSSSRNEYTVNNAGKTNIYRHGWPSITDTSSTGRSSSLKPSLKWTISGIANNSHQQ